MKGLILASVTMAGLAASVPTFALPVDAFYYAGPGLGLAIPDDDPNGVQSTISVPDDLSIEKIAIIVVMDHTWVGDLIFTLTGPDGQTITLLDRPGTTDPAIDAGDSSNASVAYPIILGDWTLSVSDNAGLDLGVLDGWLIAFGYSEIAVPLPAGVWLFASGLVALSARRRRQ